MHSYFDNVTFLSLFHRPTFDTTVLQSAEPGVASALLAAMCAFAAHYVESGQACDQIDPSFGQAGGSRASSKYYQMARSIIGDQLDLCGDSRPPLALLQAYILVTFYEMMVGPSGAPQWRSPHFLSTKYKSISAS